MHVLCYCFLAAVVLAGIDARSIGNASDMISISSGVSFGMCYGYCRRSIKITSNPHQILSFKEANHMQETFPPVIKADSFSAEQWQTLVSLIDVSAFQALNEQIGCPDCADGGAEWIEIQVGDTVKRVTFENRRTIKGFEALVVELRNLRNQHTNGL